MHLQIDAKPLRAFMADFYVMSGIRIALFDASGTEILSYPADGVPFCREMRKCAAFARLCRESDLRAFSHCAETEKVLIYRCHAGLMEAVYPLRENGEAIGYLMFGQVGSRKDRAALTEDLEEVCRRFSVRVPRGAVSRLKMRSEEQIRACAKVLEACAAYIRQKGWAVPLHQNLIARLEQYVEEHPDGDLSVRGLCSALAVSRSSLYRLFPERRGGIASYVRKVRMEKAKELLETTDFSAGQVAAAVGFADEAYFRRVFRKETGRSVQDVREKEWILSDCS